MNALRILIISYWDNNTDRSILSMQDYQNAERIITFRGSSYKKSIDLGCLLKVLFIYAHQIGIESLPL